MPPPLTARQRAIFEFIVECVRARGIPPSLTEIANAFELASVSGVADHLRAIERKGYIRRRPGMSRGIELVERRRRSARHGAAVQVPIIGTLPARRRLVATGSNRKHLLFDGRVAQSGAVAVRVDLAGLETRGILPGDYLVAIEGAVPSAGEMALVQWNRATVLVEALPGRKRVRRIEDNTELGDTFDLLGKVVAVLRSVGDMTRTSPR